MERGRPGAGATDELIPALATSPILAPTRTDEGSLPEASLSEVGVPLPEQGALRV